MCVCMYVCVCVCVCGLNEWYLTSLHVCRSIQLNQLEKERITASQEQPNRYATMRLPTVSAARGVGTVQPRAKSTDYRKQCVCLIPTRCESYPCC